MALEFEIIDIMWSQSGHQFYVVCADPKTHKILGRIELQKFKKLVGRPETIVASGANKAPPGDSRVDN